MERLESLPNKAELDFAEIRKAIYYARKYHDGQKRHSGEPFYSHPIEVAYMISEYLPKTHIIVASILHDIVEDTEMTIGMMLDQFGFRIAEIVDRLTRDRPDGTKLSVEEILNNAYEKGDEETLLIKLVDRLHNAKSCALKTLDKQNKLYTQILEHFLCYSYFLEKYSLSQKFENLSSVFFKKNNTKNRDDFLMLFLYS
jgi:(p)ppGpp synthase/HD superfamily hydrolase